LELLPDLLQLLLLLLGLFLRLLLALRFLLSLMLLLRLLGLVCRRRLSHWLLVVPRPPRLRRPDLPRPPPQRLVIVTMVIIPHGQFRGCLAHRERRPALPLLLRLDQAERPVFLGFRSIGRSPLLKNLGPLRLSANIR
jgi:hypothetical protein